jgi:hypothetical protein
MKQAAAENALLSLNLHRANEKRMHNAPLQTPLLEIYPPPRPRRLCTAILPRVENPQTSQATLWSSLFSASFQGGGRSNPPRYPIFARFGPSHGSLRGYAKTTAEGRPTKTREASAEVWGFLPPKGGRATAATAACALLRHSTVRFAPVK